MGLKLWGRKEVKIFESRVTGNAGEAVLGYFCFSTGRFCAIPFSRPTKVLLKRLRVLMEQFAAA